ncbi:MAG: helix-turn-helix domain-containing protein [Thiobacillaceae bacterium]
MPTVTQLDAGAAAAASLVIGQAATLCALLALRLGDLRLAHSARAVEENRFGEPAVPAPVMASVWLLITIASAAGQATGDLVQHLGLHLLGHWLSPLTNAALLLVGPSMWLYACAIAHQPGDRLPTWRDFGLHAVPAMALAALVGADVLVDPMSAPGTSDQRSWPELLVLSPIAAQILAYLGAVVWRVRKLRPQLQQRFSSVEHRQLRWLEAGAFTFAALVLAWVATWQLPVAASNMVTNGLLAADLAILGIFGARQKNVFGRHPWIEEAPTARAPHLSSSYNLHRNAPSAQPAGDAPASAPPRPLLGKATAPQDSSAVDTLKYSKSAISAELAATLSQRLDQVMAVDKSYLESDLTLAELAERVGATPHQLSQVLSVHVGLSFFEYVNGLRVEAVKATLARPQSVGRPLLDIALECGFGSKSAFNDAFKRATGMSPGAFRKGLPAVIGTRGRPA